MNTEICQLDESDFEEVPDLDMCGTPRRTIVRRRIDFMLSHTHAAFLCSKRKTRVVVVADGILSVEEFCKKVFCGDYDSQLA